MLEGISLLYHPRGQLDDCLRLTILERGYRKAEGEGKHRETTAGVITGRWYNIIYCHIFICQELKFLHNNKHSRSRKGDVFIVLHISVLLVKPRCGA